MRMQIEVTKKPKSTITVKGSLSVEEFNTHIENVTKHFVEEAELPGFRKGKAPEKMVVEKIGESAILEDAANEALRALYPRILKDHAIEAIAHPHIRITKLARGNPFEFEADIAVVPEITLPDYKEIASKKNAAPKEEITVPDEELNKTLDWLRKSRSSKPERLTGNLPETIPELTDAFAQSVGNFKTVEELKNAIRENMKFEKEQKAHDARRMDIITAVSASSQLEIPDALVESEKNKMVAELKTNIEQMGMQWDAYLTHIKKTEAELRNEWHTQAEQRSKTTLVLREIAKREALEPREDEVSAWTYNYLAQTDENEKKNLDLERVKDYAYGVIKNKKVFEFLESCLSQP